MTWHVITMGFSLFTVCLWHTAKFLKHVTKILLYATHDEELTANAGRQSHLCGGLFFRDVCFAVCLYLHNSFALCLYLTVFFLLAHGKYNLYRVSRFCRVFSDAHSAKSVLPCLQKIAHGKL